METDSSNLQAPPDDDLLSLKSFREYAVGKIDHRGEKIDKDKLNAYIVVQFEIIEEFHQHGVILSKDNAVDMVLQHLIRRYYCIIPEKVRTKLAEEALGVPINHRGILAPLILETEAGSCIGRDLISLKLMLLVKCFDVGVDTISVRDYFIEWELHYQKKALKNQVSEDDVEKWVLERMRSKVLSRRCMLNNTKVRQGSKARQSLHLEDESELSTAFEQSTMPVLDLALGQKRQSGANSYVPKAKHPCLSSIFNTPTISQPVESEPKSSTATKVPHSASPKSVSYPSKSTSLRAEIDEYMNCKTNEEFAYRLYKGGRLSAEEYAELSAEAFEQKSKV
ncbi:hypothetical protein NHQ30_003368 [Ciborinia camelliae]|nr:hypothetical protein NHQ30_003368 [Ciborinia camelliae]